MSFTQPTKAKMFIKSSRLCCLCLKQCGTNIEAAHIIDSHAGGSDDFDNGIPVCFDCHQEIGAYDNKHPKGNKFTPTELTARRDHVYQLVESGAIHAQIIATNLRAAAGTGHPQITPGTSTVQKPPSQEVQRLERAFLADPGCASAKKISLLSEGDRAVLLDRLVAEVTTNRLAIQVLARLLSGSQISANERTLLLEQTIRSVALLGDFSSKVEILDSIASADLLLVDVSILEAFFDELLDIVEQDQYDQVNQLVPVLVPMEAAVPLSLRGRYGKALLSQARSRSFKGAPAAQRALQRLDPVTAQATLEALDQEFLEWNAGDKHIRTFVANNLQHSPKAPAFMRDFSALSHLDWVRKYGLS